MLKGQSLAEYALYIFIIAVVCVAALLVFAPAQVAELVGILP